MNITEHDVLGIDIVRPESPQVLPGLGYSVTTIVVYYRTQGNEVGTHTISLFANQADRLQPCAIDSVRNIADEVLHKAKLLVAATPKQ